MERGACLIRRPAMRGRINNGYLLAPLLLAVVVALLPSCVAAQSPSYFISAQASDNFSTASIPAFDNGGIRCGTFTTGAATVSVNTTINSNCTISATPITFGNYDPIGANSASGIALTAPGTISLTCLKGSSPTIDVCDWQPAMNSRPTAAARIVRTGE